MGYNITQFAAAHAEKADLFQSLGIDWKMLALQTAAFLILLAVLKKWVYPPLVAMLDQREAELQASAKAARTAQKEAEAAEAKTAALLKEARAEAGAIVAAARDEAAEVVEAAHQKATDKAEALLQSARDDITKEVETAKKTLHAETIELVAAATGTVLRQKVDATADTQLIQSAVKEARS